MLATVDGRATISVKRDRHNTLIHPRTRAIKIIGQYGLLSDHLLIVLFLQFITVCP